MAVNLLSIKKGIFVLFFLSIINRAHSDTIIGPGTTDFIGFTTIKACDDYIVKGSGTTVGSNNAGLFNVKKALFEAGSNLVINDPNFTFDISSWKNDGLTLTGSIPNFTFNSCGAFLIEGVGDLDGDGVSDGQENCLVPGGVAPNGPYAFSDPNVVGCRAVSNSVEPVPSTNFYTLLLMLLGFVIYIVKTKSIKL